MYWARSVFLTTIIVFITIVFCEKCIRVDTSVPKKDVSLPTIYLLLGEGGDTREWLDIYDEKPLLISAYWNYSPIPSLAKFEGPKAYKTYARGVTMFLRKIEKPMYEVPTARDLVKTENLEQRLWTYYGRIMLSLKKGLNIERKVSFQWVKNGETVYQKKVELPINILGLKQPCEGLVFKNSMTEREFYWESVPDNDEASLWLKNYILTETKNNETLFSDLVYKVWIE